LARRELFQYLDSCEIWHPALWMRNTVIPLDIAFIDRNGFILEIQQMEPHDDAAHASKQPAMYALELRMGWFEDHGVEPGERVEF